MLALVVMLAAVPAFAGRTAEGYRYPIATFDSDDVSSVAISGVLSTTRANRCQIYVDNSAGAATNDLTIQCANDSAGTDVVASFDVIGVTSGSRQMVEIDPRFAATVDTWGASINGNRFTRIGYEPCHDYMTVTLAAQSGVSRHMTVKCH